MHHPLNRGQGSGPTSAGVHVSDESDRVLSDWTAPYRTVVKAFEYLIWNCNYLEITKFILVKDHLFISNKKRHSKHHKQKKDHLSNRMVYILEIKVMRDNVYTLWAHMISPPCIPSGFHFILPSAGRHSLLLLACSISKLPIMSNRSLSPNPQLWHINSKWLLPDLGPQSCPKGRIMRYAANSTGPIKLDFLRQGWTVYFPRKPRSEKDR